MNKIKTFYIRQAIKNNRDADDFVKTLKIELTGKIIALSYLCRNYNKNVDFKKVFQPVFDNIKDQAENHFGNSTRFDLIYPNYNYSNWIRVSANDDQFVKSYKTWVAQMFDGLKIVKKKHPWFDVKKVAYKILAIRI